MSVSSVQSPSLNALSNAGSGGSWMAAIAEALAKAMEKLQTKMETEAGNLSSSDKKTADKANTDLQVDAQMYTLVVNAVTTVLKTVGEADNSLAQKQ